MNTLNIVNAKTLQISKTKCLENIRELRKTGKVIVICPDRMALQVENEIFDILKVSSLFDCDVYTMSRLSLKVLNKLNNNKKILTKQLAVTIIKKILLENNFSSFKGVVNFNGFALKLFEIISMFKSSKITPKMLLENTTNKILIEKLTDLNIIYEKYEEFLQNDYTDSFNKLDLFASSISDEFKDTHIVIVGFNDFTKQMFNIIKVLIEKSKSVTIATASSYGFKEINNNNLFVNNVFHSLVELCKTNGFIYHIDVVNKNISEIKDFLLNNLYAYNVTPYEKECNEIKVVSFANESSELDFVLKDIKYKVIKNNLKYGNFSICVPNLNSKKLELQTKFEEFDIPYFLDASITLSETNLCRFVTSIFEAILYNFKKEEFLNVLKNVYSNINMDLVSNFETSLKEKGIDYVTINDVKEFEEIKNIYEHISILNNKNNKTIGEYILTLKELFETLNIIELTNNIILNLENNGDYVKAKDYKLAYEKFENAMIEIDNLINGYETSLINFYKILQVYLDNVTVTIPPIVGDVVMVYDINNSFIVENDYMYILSCVEGLVPQTISDVSIISDNEINLFDNNLKLSPTCDNVNKRNKFKIFENILQYKKQLTITYYNSNMSSNTIESSLITNLLQLVPNIKLINGDNYISNYNYFKNIENKYIFELNNVSFNSAYKNFINLTKNFDINFNVDNFNKYYYSLLESLPDIKLKDSILNNNNFNNQTEKLLNTNIYFNNKFNDNRYTSVSEIETYYSCPYKHFIRYGLNLKELKNGFLMPNDIGNILHEFNSLIIGYLSDENLTDEKIKNLSNEVLNKIINEKYSQFLNNNKNKSVIKNLYAECFRFAKSLYNQLKNSEFKNKYNEKSFSNLKELSVTHNGVTIYVKGIIDRMDICEDMFSLIDYKTGQDMFSYTELNCGKKLQLFVYVKAANLMLNKTPVCVCYLPIKNDFSKTEINQYKFKGVFINELNKLTKLDKNVLDASNSNLGIKIKKDGNFDERSKAYCLTEKEIMELSNFAFSLVEKAVEEILDGNIEPNPLLIGNKSACEYCLYKGICNFNKLYKNKYRVASKITSANEILNKENNE